MVEIDHECHILPDQVMTRISITRSIPISPSLVWPAIADIESHPRWMTDAEWLVFIGDQTRGVGTRMEVKTVVGPFRTIDKMEVVGWKEGRYIDVRHVGLVTGTGRLSVEPGGDGSVIGWDEELEFPWWLGGSITSFLARPVLRRIWASNLERLEQVINDL